MLKRKLAHELTYKISFVGSDGTPKLLSCVSDYKHLGSTKSSTVTMAAEIRAKCSAITGAVANLRPRVMANDRISMRTKANLFQAVLLSRVLFNAGAWPILTSAEHTRIHSAILKYLRTIAASNARMGQSRAMRTPAKSHTSSTDRINANTHTRATATRRLHTNTRHHTQPPRQPHPFTHYISYQLDGR